MLAMSRFFFVLEDKKTNNKYLLTYVVQILKSYSWGLGTLDCYFYFWTIFKFCPYYTSSTMVGKYNLLGN